MLQAQEKPAETPAQGAQKVIIVLDASGSMWGQVKGEAKIDIARGVIRDLVADFPEDIDLGLLAYGHRRKGDCEDIELLIEPGPLDRQEFVRTVEELLPRGKTPLTDAVVKAAEHLKYTEDAATVILVSDGIETCDRDPCAVSEQLEQTGVNFTAHVVGFDLSVEDAKSIDCIANNTGGRFLPAGDAGSLKDALDLAIEEVKTAQAPQPEAEPEPEPEEPEASLEAPAEVLAGSDFEVAWKGQDEKGDYITIVPKNADDKDYANFAYTRQGNPLTLTALIEPQAAELRYRSGRTGKVLGRRDITVTPVQATLEAPSEAVVGSEVPVTWEGPDYKGDYLTIVKPDAEEGEYNRYEYTRAGSPAKVEAPMAAGNYEIRYVTGQRDKTLARRPITLTEAVITLEAPEEAVAGAVVPINWEGPDNNGDYITIVAKDAEEATTNKRAFTQAGSPAKVQAPLEVGQYEIRYISGQGRMTLGSRPITLTEAEVALEAPEEAVAGSVVPIIWTGPDNKGDYITIVEKGADEGTTNKREFTKTGSPAKVQAPLGTGQYEIRYISGQGRETLARRPITLTEAEITLEAPEEAVAGSVVPITWSGPDNRGDYITIVAKDAEEGTTNKREFTQAGSPAKVEAPLEVGQYEIRYISGQGRETLAGRPITLTEAEITLEAPEEAVAGSVVPITFVGPNNPRDFITIVAPDAEEGSSNKYKFTSGGSPVKVEAPVETGDFEIRYVAGQGRKTLDSRPITLTEPRISFEAPEEVVAGQPITITWEGPDNPRDHIAIAKKDAEPNKYEVHQYTTHGSPLKLKPVEDAGEYELRYISGQGRKILARAPITVTAGE